MRLLSGDEVARLLDIDSCIRCVEEAFCARGTGHRAPSATLGFPLPGGSLHAKVGSLELRRSYAAAKINANIPGNPTERALPTIQGILVLFDASSGAPLAVMDSASITTARTAAASAVAAKHLARASASTVTFVGCGVQAEAHLRALGFVRPLARIFAVDTNVAAAERFARAGSEQLESPIIVSGDIRACTRASDIIVTTTPSPSAILHFDDVREGTFIAAVGADNEDKQELDVELLRRAVVVVDDLDQCARMGDLHHALAAGVMEPNDVRGSLDEIVAGVRPARLNDSEIIVFDSTGIAIEDVAAAALVYESAEERGIGFRPTWGP